MNYEVSIPHTSMHAGRTSATVFRASSTKIASTSTARRQQQMRRPALWLLTVLCPTTPFPTPIITRQATPLQRWSASHRTARTICPQRRLNKSIRTYILGMQTHGQYAMCVVHVCTYWFLVVLQQRDKQAGTVQFGARTFGRSWLNCNGGGFAAPTGSSKRDGTGKKDS